jgi:hypothetical protein
MLVVENYSVTESCAEFVNGLDAVFVIRHVVVACFDEYVGYHKSSLSVIISLRCRLLARREVAEFQRFDEVLRINRFLDMGVIIPC